MPAATGEMRRTRQHEPLDFAAVGEGSVQGGQVVERGRAEGTQVIAGALQVYKARVHVAPLQLDGKGCRVGRAQAVDQRVVVYELGWERGVGVGGWAASRMIDRKNAADR